MRICSRCKIEKPTDAFPKDRGICRSCKTEVTAEWRKANPERAAATQARTSKKWKAAQSEESKRRRADRANELRRARTRRGQVMTTTCAHCSLEFTYVWNNKARTVCDLCRSHDAEWRTFRLNGPEVELLRAITHCQLCGTANEFAGGRFGILHIDHDHATGRVRGVLCANCNTSLGLMKDDPSLLRRAADYLEAGSEGILGSVSNPEGITE